LSSKTKDYNREDYLKKQMKSQSVYFLKAE
jgi:hypothetical protein